MGVGTWSPRPHLDLARLLAEPRRARPAAGRAARARPAPGLRQRRRQPAARPRAPRAPRRRTALRGAIELAALLGVDTRRDDERLPRRPRRQRLDRRVRRLLAVLRRRAALGVAVPRARRALLARALGLGRDGRSGRAHLPRAAPRADDLRRRELRAPARRGRRRTSASTSTRATSGGRASTRSRSSSSTATRSASRTARTRCSTPSASACTALLDAALPDRPGHGLVALHRRRRRPPARASGGRCSPRCARAATTAWSRSSTRIRRSRPRPRSRPRRTALREALGMAVTLNDVARRAGVSKSTVSNVVRGATPVAPVTRRRVEAAISELGYRPERGRARAQAARHAHARARHHRHRQPVRRDARAGGRAARAPRRLRRPDRRHRRRPRDRGRAVPRARGAARRRRHLRRAGGGLDEPRRPARPRRADDAGLLRRHARPRARARSTSTRRRRMDAVIGYLADLGHERFAFARQHAREAEVDRRPQAFSAAVRRRGLQRGRASTPTRRPSAA